MAHTLKINDQWLVISDSVLDDESVVTVIFQTPTAFEDVVKTDQLEIPYAVFAAVVANQVRSKRIAEIEQMSDDEILI